MMQGWQKLGLFFFGLTPILPGLVFYWAMLPKVEVETSVIWCEREEQERLLPPLHTTTFHEPGIRVKIRNTGWATAYLDMEDAAGFFTDGVSHPLQKPTCFTLPPPPIAISPGSTRELDLPFGGQNTGQEIVTGLYLNPYSRFDFPFLYRWGIFRTTSWTPGVVLPPNRPSTVALTKETE